MAHLFSNLESNENNVSEDAKNELLKTFSHTKDPWLVAGIMEYFSTSNSNRIVDVLAKVQSPHDYFIFDKILDWMNSAKRNSAFSMLWQLIRKQPLWIHRILPHGLFRELLKFLRTETNIAAAMSALFCLIILLPVIPTDLPAYLNELFDVFMHLSIWKTKNVPELSVDEQIHLQIGLTNLFHRLYGMFPCNFTFYLREHVKNQNAVYEKVIFPLFESVKMHPLLLTSNRDSERSSSRWKEMEPHDVVVECSRLALENNVNESPDMPEVNYSGEVPWYRQGESSISWQDKMALMKNPQTKALTSLNQIWSPSETVLATPPPTNLSAQPTAPLLVSPNYLTQSKGPYSTGASPPEAAIEATPETTPAKDRTVRMTPIQSSAARQIWNNEIESTSPESNDDTSIENLFEMSIQNQTKLENKIKRINTRITYDIQQEVSESIDIGIENQMLGKPTTELVSNEIGPREKSSLYKHMTQELSTDLRVELNRSNNNKFNTISPHVLLDQYIEAAIRRYAHGENASPNKSSEMLLLYIQLQYERYRRDIHAERNRRLLGKCRDNVALKMDNDKLRHNSEKMNKEIADLQRSLNEAKLIQNNQQSKFLRECETLRTEIQSKFKRNKQLQQGIEELKRDKQIEAGQIQEMKVALESAQAKIFDLQNLLSQSQQRVELSKKYKEDLRRLQQKQVLAGEMNHKFAEKLLEIEQLRSEEKEYTSLKHSYSEEITEIRSVLDMKTAQLAAADDKINYLQQQITRRDNLFADHKRHLQATKDEWDEKLKAVEAKYTAQKAIVLKLEETIMELYKSGSAVNLSSVLPDLHGQDMTGSLDRGSPLSTSLASSEGLSWSLRSVTEIKNLSQLAESASNHSVSTQLNGLSMSPIPTNRPRQSEDIQF